MVRKRVLDAFNQRNVFITKPDEGDWYIALDYIPQSNDIISFKIRILDTLDNKCHVYFGTRANTSPNNDCSLYTWQNQLDSGVNGTFGFHDYDYGTIFEVENFLTWHGLTFNGFSATLPMYLWAFNMYGSPDFYDGSNMEFYYLSVKRNGVLIHDYVATKNGNVKDLVSRQTFEFNKYNLTVTASVNNYYLLPYNATSGTVTANDVKQLITVYVNGVNIGNNFTVSGSTTWGTRVGTSAEIFHKNFTVTCTYGVKSCSVNVPLWYDDNRLSSPISFTWITAYSRNFTKPYTSPSLISNGSIINEYDSGKYFPILYRTPVDYGEYMGFYLDGMRRVTLQSSMQKYLKYPNDAIFTYLDVGDDYASNTNDIEVNRVSIKIYCIDDNKTYYVENYGAQWSSGSSLKKDYMLWKKSSYSLSGKTCNIQCQFNVLTYVATGEYEYSEASDDWYPVYREEVLGTINWTRNGVIWG